MEEPKDGAEVAVDGAPNGAAVEETTNGDGARAAVPNGVGAGEAVLPNGVYAAAAGPRKGEGGKVDELPKGDVFAANIVEAAAFVSLTPKEVDGVAEAAALVSVIPKGVNGVDETASGALDVGEEATESSGFPTLYFAASLANISFSLPLYFSRVLTMVSLSPARFGLCFS
jgi:hypothetical protein